MPAADQVPTPVKVIAWLFIIAGVSYALEPVVGLTQGRVTLHAGVLGIFIGRGLLRGSDVWRRAAFWLSAIAVPFCLAIGVWMIGAGIPVKTTVFGVPTGYVSSWFGAISCLGFAAVPASMAYVLTQERARAAFPPAVRAG